MRPPSLELGTPGLGNRWNATISAGIQRKTPDLYENFMNWSGREESNPTRVKTTTLWNDFANAPSMMRVFVKFLPDAECS